MKLFRSKKEEDNATEKVKSARFQVDLAVLKMEHLLDQVQDTANRAKEELSAGRTS